MSNAGQLDHVAVTTAGLCSWVHWPHHIQKTLFHGTPPQHAALLSFPPPLLQGSLSCRRDVRYEDPLRARESTVTYFPYFAQFRYVLTTIYCKKASLMRRLKARYNYDIFIHYHFTWLICWMFISKCLSSMYFQKYLNTYIIYIYWEVN